MKRPAFRILQLTLALMALSWAATSIAAAPAGDQAHRPVLVPPDWCRKLPRPEYAHLERVPVHEHWFEVYRVQPHVLAIYEPHQWQETVMYLVKGQKRALLVDTGMGIGNLRALVAELTTLPVIVVNTHTHVDHVGSNWRFDTVYNLDSDYSRKSARGSTGVREEIEPRKLCGALPKDFDKATYATRPWHTSRWLHDGDTIDLGGRSLRVLATPGHSPDSISLFDARNGLLFTGDTYYPGPIYVFGPGADPAAYQRSVDRLAALAPKVRYVLGGHNVPLASPSILPELAREFAELRSGKLAPVKSGPRVTEYHGARLIFFVTTSDGKAGPAN